MMISPIRDAIWRSYRMATEPAERLVSQSRRHPSQRAVLRREDRPGSTAVHSWTRHKLATPASRWIVDGQQPSIRDNLCGTGVDRVDIGPRRVDESDVDLET